MSATFFLTYGKSFGLKYINDDSFFSYVGIINNVLNGTSRIAWGKMYDWKGFKLNSYIIAICPAVASMAVNLLIYIPTENEMGNKLLFASLSSIFFAVNPGVYPIIAPTIQATFGPLNYARDYGMIFTQSVSFKCIERIQCVIHFFQMLGGILLIFVRLFLQEAIGYSGLFLLSGLFGLIAVVAAWFFREESLIS